MHWEVDEFLDRNIVDGEEYFRVKWQGTSEIAWEPEHHLGRNALVTARAKFRVMNCDDDDDNDNNGKSRMREHENAGEVACVDFEKSGYFLDDSEVCIL